MTQPTAARSWRASGVVCVVLVALALALPWFSLFDHPIWPPEEGRYGQVAARMVNTGDWLVPYFEGRAHLTKPPLAYWAQAMGLEMFGRGPLALRLPSALATSVVVLGLVLLGWLVKRPMAGVCAALLFAVLPLTMVAGRLAAPDALLNMLWFGSLVGGLLACHGGATGWRRVAWLVLFWGSAGLACMAKAPLGAAPVVIVCTWLVVMRQWRALARLGWWWGVPLMLAPCGVWVWLIYQGHPDVLATMWEQSVGRVTGDLGKHDPWWTYIPVFLLGLWPATTMLTLPGFNFSWRNTWARLTQDPVCTLMVVAVVGPLCVFSISAGKLPHYLLPVAAPLAFLIGMMLEGQMRPAAALGSSTDRPPDVRFTYLASVALGMAGCMVAAALAPPELGAHWWWGLVLVPAFAGALWLVWVWWDRQRRTAALVVAWLGMACTWYLALECEDHIFDRLCAHQLTDVVAEVSHQNGRLLVLADDDTTRAFYYGPHVVELGRLPRSIRQAVEHLRPGDLLLVEDRLLPDVRAALASSGWAEDPAWPPRPFVLLWTTHATVLRPVRAGPQG